MKALEWITKEAKKLRKDYPKRFATWREYVAQASAIYASKHKGKSPVGKKNIGALPVGFKGSFLGFKFDIVNQYTIDGGVTAIIRDSEFNKLFELNGRKEDEAKGSKILYGSAISYWTANKGHFLNDRDKSQLTKRIDNFVKQLNKEVKDYNTGKDKTTKKSKPVKIVYTPEVKKLSLIQEIKTLLKDNNKIMVRGYKMKTGKIRKISGTSSHKDTKSHNVNIRVVSGIKGLTKISGVDPHKAKYFIEYTTGGIKKIEYFDKLPKGIYYAGGYQDPKDKGKAYVMKLTDSGTSLIPLYHTKNNIQVKKRLSK